MKRNLLIFSRANNIINLNFDYNIIFYRPYNICYFDFFFLNLKS